MSDPDTFGLSRTTGQIGDAGARYEKVRHGGVVISVAVLIAIATGETDKKNERICKFTERMLLYPRCLLDDYQICY